MRYKRNRKNVLILTLFIFGVVSFFGPADAMRFKPGGDTTIDCDVTVKYGAGWRVSDRDKDQLYNPANPDPLSNNINRDDGNENFDKWSMYNNKITLIADIDVQHKNFGLFARPKAFYDHVYFTDNDNSSQTNNMFVGKLIGDNDEWSDDVEDIHGQDAEILDLFAYVSLDLGGHFTEIRVGRQVVGWGESLLVSGGVASAMSYADLSAAVSVGTELKEIYLPSESIFLQMDLTDNLSFGAFYQWKWDKHRLMEGGTLFASRLDVIDEIKAPVIMEVAPGVVVPIIPRGQDDDASDSGQYGIALTYVWERLYSTEFGLYYVNYHDKVPTPNFGANYFLSYTEDIKLYGVSYSSQIGDANISGEFSYRQDYKFDAATKANYWQAQTSVMYANAVRPIADLATIIAEIGCNQMIGTPDDTFAWRYVIRGSVDWMQVLRDLDIKLNLAFSDSPSGTLPVSALGFNEGASSGSIGFEFLYKELYKATITYENRFNGVKNVDSDRDTLGITLSYTF